MASIPEATQAVIDAMKAVAEHTAANVDRYNPEGVQELASANRQMAEAVAWLSAPDNGH